MLPSYIPMKMKMASPEYSKEDNNKKEILDRDRHPTADPERFHNFGKQLTIFLRQISIRSKLCLFT